MTQIAGFGLEQYMEGSQVSLTYEDELIEGISYELDIQSTIDV